MKFEELPETPKIWIDFLHSRLSFLPAPCEMESLPVRLDALRGRATGRGDVCRHLLGQSGSVAVIATFYPSLFGGTVAQILKCLTAIKVCEALAKRNLAAVPVCWIDTALPLEFREQPVRLLDPESELHCLRFQPSELVDFAPGDPLPRTPISRLLSQIGELGKGAFDTEVLEILKAAFLTGKTVFSACAHLISDLMKEWGMVVLDANAPPLEPILTETFGSNFNQAGRIEVALQKQTPEFAAADYAGDFSEKVVRTILAQGLVLPMAAYIVDPYEVHSYARALPVFDEIGLPRPLAWPRASATLVDARSRRILGRYNLGIEQLYAGAEEATQKVGETIPRSAPGKLDELKLEVETRLAELGALAPSENEFERTSGSCKGKMVYQLEKLKANCVAAVTKKEQSVSRQIRRTCNSLAPNRRAQERELAGIQISLRYSRAGLRSLYEKLDIGTIEHQLIPMD